MIGRSLAPCVIESLQDTPAVYLQGPRQCGKSTLAQSIAEGPRRADYFSLDSAAVLTAAVTDPDGFIAGLRGPVVIDEVQRAPALALAIKRAVDKDRTPGRFLLTGSAHVMALPRLADSLAGRMDLHTLWPFSQGEMEGLGGSLVDRLYADEPVDFGREREWNSAELVERIVLGGYPEAVLRKKSAVRRGAWFESYLTTILQLDVRDLSAISSLAEVPRLLSLLASRACMLVNYADIARSLAMPQSTLKRYMALLQSTFLVTTLPAWSANLGKRLAKSSKLVLTDTGLLSHLLAFDRSRARQDRTLFGHVLENFVATELIKQLTWSRTRAQLYHFRTSAGDEVDFVLEHPSLGLVGIEVKAGATLRAKDLSALRLLSQLAKARFRRGVVLFMGNQTVPLGENLFALPIASLWRTI